VFKKVVTCTQ